MFLCKIFEIIIIKFRHYFIKLTAAISKFDQLFVSMQEENQTFAFDSDIATDFQYSFVSVLFFLHFGVEYFEIFDDNRFRYVGIGFIFRRTIRSGVFGLPHTEKRRRYLVILIFPSVLFAKNDTKY